MNAAQLSAYADRLAIPLRTLDDVRECLTEAKKQNSDAAMARMMVKFGRLTDEARIFASNWK